MRVVKLLAAAIDHRVSPGRTLWGAAARAGGRERGRRDDRDRKCHAKSWDGHLPASFAVAVVPLRGAFGPSACPGTPSPLPRRRALLPLKEVMQGGANIAGALEKPALQLPQARSSPRSPGLFSSALAPSLGAYRQRGAS